MKESWLKHLARSVIFFSKSWSLFKFTTRNERSFFPSKRPIWSVTPYPSLRSLSFRRRLRLMLSLVVSSFPSSSSEVIILTLPSVTILCFTPRSSMTSVSFIPTSMTLSPAWTSFKTSLLPDTIAHSRSSSHFLTLLMPLSSTHLAISSIIDLLMSICKPPFRL